MHVSAIEEYGLRCALQLARSHGTTPLSASKVSEREGISIEYVSKLMHLFRKSGLVLASRGVQGGFYLSLEPQNISVKAVLDAIRGVRKPAKKTDDGFCGQFTGQHSECTHLSECGVRPIWKTLSTYFDDLLTELTLGDLLMKERQVQDHVSRLALSKSKQLKTWIKEY